MTAYPFPYHTGKWGEEIQNFSFQNFLLLLLPFPSPSDTQSSEPHLIFPARVLPRWLSCLRMLDLSCHSLIKKEIIKKQKKARELTSLMTSLTGVLKAILASWLLLSAFRSTIDSYFNLNLGQKSIYFLPSSPAWLAMRTGLFLEP